MTRRASRRRRFSFARRATKPPPRSRCGALRELRGVCPTTSSRTAAAQHEAATSEEEFRLELRELARQGVLLEERCTDAETREAAARHEREQLAAARAGDASRHRAEVESLRSACWEAEARAAALQGALEREAAARVDAEARFHAAELLRVQAPPRALPPAGPAPTRRRARAALRARGARQAEIRESMRAVDVYR